MRNSACTDPPARIHGFAPIENTSARILILGSMPGEASLRAGQYYAHPQNRFWKVVGEILAGAHAGSAIPANLREACYEEKLRTLELAGIALWDVLASCHREGSLDSDIEPGTLVANDFAAFLASHRRIQRVLFNGAKAEACFRRHVAPTLALDGIERVKLPSTSAANASIAYMQIVEEWSAALRDGDVLVPSLPGFRAP